MPTTSQYYYINPSKEDHPLYNMAREIHEMCRGNPLAPITKQDFVSVAVFDKEGPLMRLEQAERDWSNLIQSGVLTTRQPARAKVTAGYKRGRPPTRRTV